MNVRKLINNGWTLHTKQLADKNGWWRFLTVNSKGYGTVEWWVLDPDFNL